MDKEFIKLKLRKENDYEKGGRFAYIRPQSIFSLVYDSALNATEVTITTSFESDSILVEETPGQIFELAHKTCPPICDPSPNPYRGRSW